MRNHVSGISEHFLPVSQAFSHIVECVLHMLDFNPNGVLLMAEKSMSPTSIQGRMTYRVTSFCKYFPSVTTNKFENRWGNSD